MYAILKNIKLFFEFIRCFPHLIIFLIHSDRSVIRGDIIRWLDILGKAYNVNVGLIFLLAFHKAFRNLFYYRIGVIKYILNIFCPQISSLQIQSKYIGEGLFIWHGHGTGINANYIGKNCTINQLVSIGNNNGYPTILDNVTILTGAIIVGKVTIGNNTTIGANATVIQNVPDNCTVFSPTPKIMKWKSK